MPGNIVVRPALPEDSGEILRLIRQLAAVERSPYSVAITEDVIRADGFGPTRRFEVLLAVQDGQVCGATVLFQAYSSWNGAPTMTIHDLFVDADMRGLGIGKALLAALARLAIDRGCCRVDVNVLAWNTSARRFYEHLGFTHTDDWLPYRLDRAGVERLGQLR